VLRFAARWMLCKGESIYNVTGFWALFDPLSPHVTDRSTFRDPSRSRSTNSMLLSTQKLILKVRIMKKAFLMDIHCNFERLHFIPISFIVKPSGARHKAPNLTWPRVTRLHGRQARCRLLLGGRTAAEKRVALGLAIAKRGTRHYTKTWYTARGLVRIG